MNLPFPFFCFLVINVVITLLGGAEIGRSERMMGFRKDTCYRLVFCICIGFCLTSQCFADEVYAYQTAQLLVNASDAVGKPIPETLFGIFFEVCPLSYYSFFGFVGGSSIYFLIMSLGDVF